MTRKGSDMSDADPGEAGGDQGEPAEVRASLSGSNLLQTPSRGLRRGSAPQAMSIVIPPSNRRPSFSRDGAETERKVRTPRRPGLSPGRPAVRRRSATTQAECPSHLLNPVGMDVLDSRIDPAGEASAVEMAKYSLVGSRSTDDSNTRLQFSDSEDELIGAEHFSSPEQDLMEMRAVLSHKGMAVPLPPPALEKLSSDTEIAVTSCTPPPPCKLELSSHSVSNIENVATQAQVTPSKSL